MKLINHNELETLRGDAHKLAESLGAELEARRKRMSELQSEDSKKKFSAEFLRHQIETERKRAKQIAADQRAAVAAVKARIENAANFWSTEARLRKAKFAEGDSVHDSILEELRRLRVSQEIKDARPDELVQHVREAGQSGNLAELEMLRREAKRRELSERERLPLTLALDEALENVEIEGQRAAHAALEAALASYSTAEDAVYELRTGKESLHGEMIRLVAKHFPPDAQTA